VIKTGVELMPQKTGLIVIFFFFCSLHLINAETEKNLPKRVSPCRFIGEDWESSLIRFSKIFKAIQPDYEKWNLIKRGMPYSEVEKFLGKPLRTYSGVEVLKTPPNLAVIAVYGVLSPKSDLIPYDLEFTIRFEVGKVHRFSNPYGLGEIPITKIPTTPRMVYPEENYIPSPDFDILDFRCFPSPGAYPICYMLELDIFLSPQGWIVQTIENNYVPYWNVRISGLNKYRWRVKAVNKYGESPWSEYRYLGFKELDIKSEKSDLEKANDYYKSGDYTKAFDIYNKLADKNNLAGMSNLALMYRTGNGVEQNYKKAFEWYKKAATHGDPVSQFNLSIMFKHGSGVDKNLRESFYWLYLAAMNGDTQAQMFLGVAYAKGLGTTHDYTRAAYWYEIAAKRGNLWAIYKLGYLYWEGNGVKKNTEEAIRLFESAVKQDFIPAKDALANLYIELDFNLDKALVLALEIVNDSPEESSCWTTLGKVYCKLGKYPEATAAYRRALAIDPKSSEIQNLLQGTVGRRPIRK